jgi:hypothetical protein
MSLGDARLREDGGLGIMDTISSLKKEADVVDQNSSVSQSEQQCRCDGLLRKFESNLIRLGITSRALGPSSPRTSSHPS